MEIYEWISGFIRMSLIDWDLEPFWGKERYLWNVTDFLEKSSACGKVIGVRAMRIVTLSENGNKVTMFIFVIFKEYKYGT